MSNEEEQEDGGVVHGSMADNHAQSMTSWCDCQAWLPQERGESMAHEVVESVSSAEKSQQPKDPRLSALEEMLEKTKNNIVLNQKFAGEGQKDINCLANQGDLANLSESAQKQEDVTNWINTQ